MCTSWNGVIAQLTCSTPEEAEAQHKSRDAPVDLDDVKEIRVGATPEASGSRESSGAAVSGGGESLSNSIGRLLETMGGGEGETYDQHMRKACVPANFGRAPFGDLDVAQLEWWNGDARVAEEIDVSSDDEGPSKSSDAAATAADGPRKKRASSKKHAPSTPLSDDPVGFVPPAEEEASPLFAAALAAAEAAAREDDVAAAAVPPPPPPPGAGDAAAGDP